MGLKPAIIAPPIRPIVSRAPHLPITPGRPSVNLGHVLNSSRIQSIPHLAATIEQSNPIPFRMLAPVHQTTAQTSYGSRISTALKVLQRPTSANVATGQRPVVSFGHRVSSVVKAIVR